MTARPGEAIDASTGDGGATGGDAAPRHHKARKLPPSITTGGSGWPARPLGYEQLERDCASLPRRCRRKHHPKGKIGLQRAAETCKSNGMATTKKNAAAVALGRLGGLKGGKARAAKLTAEERRASARKAVLARWAKAKKSTKKR
jgi:hypothetical protein